MEIKEGETEARELPANGPVAESEITAYNRVALAFAEKFGPPTITETLPNGRIKHTWQAKRPE